MLTDHFYLNTKDKETFEELFLKTPIKFKQDNDLQYSAYLTFNSYRDNSYIIAFTNNADNIDLAINIRHELQHYFDINYFINNLRLDVYSTNHLVNNNFEYFMLTEMKAFYVYYKMRESLFKKAFKLLNKTNEFASFIDNIILREASLEIQKFIKERSAYSYFKIFAMYTTYPNILKSHLIDNNIVNIFDEINDYKSIVLDIYFSGSSNNDIFSFVNKINKTIKLNSLSKEIFYID